MQSVTRARLIKAAALAALLGGCGAPEEPLKPIEAKAPSAEAGYVDAPDRDCCVAIGVRRPPGGPRAVQGQHPARPA